MMQNKKKNDNLFSGKLFHVKLFSSHFDKIAKLGILGATISAAIFAYLAYDVSKDTYNEQIQSGQPFVQSNKYLVVPKGKNQISIDSDIQNYSSRVAIELTVNGYIINSDFTSVLIDSFTFNKYSSLPKGEKQPIYFTSNKIEIISENHFLLVYIRYKDSYTKKLVTQQSLLEYIPNKNNPYHYYNLITYGYLGAISEDLEQLVEKEILPLLPPRN